MVKEWPSLTGGDVLCLRTRGTSVAVNTRIRRPQIHFVFTYHLSARLNLAAVVRHGATAWRCLRTGLAVLKTWTFLETMEREFHGCSVVIGMDIMGMIFAVAPRSCSDTT